MHVSKPCQPVFLAIYYNEIIGIKNLETLFSSLPFDTAPNLLESSGCWLQRTLPEKVTAVHTLTLGFHL